MKEWGHEGDQDEKCLVLQELGHLFFRTDNLLQYRGQFMSP